ncbi:MAG: TIGR01212 family radical SAM protein, partial [Clostridiales bacterium]|nr:TIGR01212 family radical SAM protein [Clostridiales bacterium]
MPDNKPYNSLSDHLKEKLGSKTVKLSVNAGFTCPNRDGKISTGGCIFCSGSGSGDFAPSAELSIAEQLRLSREKLSGKWPNAKYIAYFQAFTNTYAPIERLRALYEEALEAPEIVALSIGTRPDCLSPEVLSLLKELNKRKPVFIEMGLQTAHDHTATFLNRAYPTEIFTAACHALSNAGIRVTAHIILGLPGETADMEIETIRYL